MAGRDTKKELETLCQALAGAMGYELVEAGIEKEHAGRYLRVYIDKPGGVSLDDCEAYHRAAQPKLEHIDYDYLEISSPGLDRPLKAQRDFDRRAGQAVSVKVFKAIGRQKEFEGRLIGLDAGQIALELPDGRVMRFPQREVAVARPVVSLHELDGLDELDTTTHSGGDGT